jgi:hypothetical protein
VSRNYVRNAHTGDRGYMSEDGKEVILDRPNEEIRVPYKKQLWNPDKHEHPLTRSQKVQVAHAADKVLLRLLGLPNTGKDWASLTDRQRIAWVKDGPSKGIRKELYGVIMELLDARFGSAD